MEQIKKISVAKVYGHLKIAELIAAGDKGIDIMQVIGVAVGTKLGESDYGQWTALTGDFEATKPVTGEVFRAATCFLPDVALTPIQVGLSQEGTRGVRFAIMVTAKFDETVTTKYSYGFRPLVPAAADDPIAQIKAQMQAALAAPEKAAANGAETEHAPAAHPARKANVAAKKGRR